MPTGKVKGTVYDLDYIQNLNWVQVIIHDGFVGVVRDVRQQQLLETAMQLETPVTVYFEEGQPNRVQRVVLQRKQPSDPPPADTYYVTGLDMNEDDGKCKAIFAGSPPTTREGFTRDVRMGSLLTTAVREGWPIGYLEIDGNTNEIQRGKLNTG